MERRAETGGPAPESSTEFTERLRYCEEYVSAYTDARRDGLSDSQAVAEADLLVRGIPDDVRAGAIRTGRNLMEQVA